MVRTALAELRAHPGRFAAVCLAILLGVGFAVGSVVFTAGFHTALTRSAAIDVSRVDVVVTAGDRPLDLARLTAVPGVKRAEPALTAYGEFSATTGHGYLELRNVPVDPDQRWYTLASGRWPAGTGELVVDGGTATRLSFKIGSRIILGSAPDERQVTVVGVLDTGLSPLAGARDAGYGSLELLRSLPASGPDIAHLTVERGTDPAQVAAAINATFGGAATATTAAAVAAAAIEELGGGTDVLTVLLLAFVVLAGLVAAMVVANTFTILITQRRRQIALLRCIGAGGGQVRRSLLVEALLVAVTGSALGLALGVAIGWIAGRAVGLADADFTVDPVSVGLAALAGIVVAVVAALAPTARASRIPPLAALRPVETAERVRTMGRVRAVLGALLLLGGGVVLGLGVYLRQLTVAVGGGAVTAVGVLSLLPVLLPAALAVLSRPAQLLGPTGRLAVANTTRHPGRATATCAALLVGVGAIVTLLVASTSAQAGADVTVGARNPIDLQLTARQDPLPTGLLPALSAIKGVRAAVVVPRTQVTVDGQDYDVFGPSDGQWHQVRNGGELAPGQVALPAYLSDSLGLRPGDPVTMRRGGVSVVLTLAPGSLTDDGSLVVLRPDLLRLDPSPAAGGIWAKFEPSAAPNDVMAGVNSLLAPYAAVDVSGAGPQRAAVAEVLRSLVRVALALLGVAVLIAVLGIGNALGLSVVERTRESALLRALGLRRRQLRLMLATEAALLAAVAAVVGTVFGVIFGWAGVGAAFREAGYPVVLSLPIGQLLAVIGGAVAAGVLASVLPARRAVRATPIQALVEV